MTPSRLWPSSSSILEVTHVALDLADDRVAAPATLELDDEEPGQVFTERQGVHRASVGRVLLTDRLKC